MSEPRKKPYQIKEAFYSLQGEGAQVGRASVFCRFSKCNLWTGREIDRANAVCDFCDTDFNGTDGQNGGSFDSPEQLANHIQSLWPKDNNGNFLGKPYVICTGGEPLLQLDAPLIAAFKAIGFEIGLETNGTLPCPEGVDWICVSPKGVSKIVIDTCDELKLVYPQTDALPNRFESIQATHRFLSPMASPESLAVDELKQTNTSLALNYCLAHPEWRLTLQTHKILNID